MPRRASALGWIAPMMALGLVGLATLGHAAPIFESDVVRPLALSPDGTRLFVANTPDARLEILRITDDGLVTEGSVPVGLEPVAVAARSASEVWVVNHLSDGISIVDVASDPPRVTRTLWVGDEPRDLVFAGPDRSRAFVTTAHRGPSSPVDPALFAGGVGRADVWVFDANDPGAGGGTPLAVLSLFGDTPRALAVSPDGATVYAAVYRSGNQTTTVSFGSICTGGEEATCEVDGKPMPGGLPAPNTNVFGDIQPPVGLIVRHDPLSGAWHDEIGRDWRDAIRLTLPDLDVFAIDAMASPPTAGAAWAHAGTILFDLAVNPVSGRVYVSNTEARNDRRFAGAGIFSGRSVRGHLHEARITVLGPDTVLPRHLNPHIDYDVVPSPPGVAERSLAQPMGMAVTADGQTLYVVAFGSNVVGILDTAALEDGTFVPSADDHIALSGGGPTGVVLDEARGRLYVATRFDTGVSVVRLDTRQEIAHLRLHDPEPEAHRAGRPFFYDARLGSSNGEASCAVCHVFGDTDALAWDLGDPDLPVVANPNPMRESADTIVGFRPLKGPMTTQTFRGIGTQGPMHWRGDRSGALDPGGDALDERAALRQFNEAFVGLMGRSAPLDEDALEHLVDFSLGIGIPPNPHRPLDGTRSGTELIGQGEFFTDGSCSGCHRLDPTNGFFGTDGLSAPTDGGIPFFLKIPPLHSVYQKIGLFEFRPPFNEADTTPVGPQVRGFGFLHDGSQGFPPSASPEKLAFVFRFPGPLAPIVGQQVTISDTADAARTARVDLLLARTVANECDLVVHGPEGTALRGWLRGPDGTFTADRAITAAVDDTMLRASASPTTPRVYTCAPPGTGARLALDRDDDGMLDGDEHVAGTDTGDAASRLVPCGGTAAATRVNVRQRVVDGRARVRLRAVLPRDVLADPSATGVAFALRDATDRLVVGRVLGPTAWRRRKGRWTADAQGWVRRAVVSIRGQRARLVVDADDPPTENQMLGVVRLDAGPDDSACAISALTCSTGARRPTITCR